MNQALQVPQSIKEAIEKHEIVPDVFSTDFNTSNLPNSLLTVEYPGELGVTMGNVLPLNKVQQAPDFQCLAIPSTETNFEIDLHEVYTLIMTDPDAPSRKDHKWSEYCHWIITGLTAEKANAQINVIKKNSTKKGELDQEIATARELVPYTPPAPPKGTGPHRYVFALFKGALNGSSSDNLIKQINENRANWGYNMPTAGVEKFANDHGGLELLAVNFFFCEQK